MTINKITDKDLNKLILYANCIVNDEEYAKDLVQDFMLKLLENNKGDLEMNSGYTFKGLRLLFLQELATANSNYRKRFKSEYEYFKSLEETEEPEEDLIQKENDIQKKIEATTKVYDELNTFDKQLYYVHYIRGISQRQISRETGIKLGVIQYRFLQIKNKIINNYNTTQNG